MKYNFIPVDCFSPDSEFYVIKFSQFHFLKELDLEYVDMKRPDINCRVFEGVITEVSAMKGLENFTLRTSGFCHNINMIILQCVKKMTKLKNFRLVVPNKEDIQVGIQNLWEKVYSLELSSRFILVNA